MMKQVQNAVVSYKRNRQRIQVSASDVASASKQAYVSKR